MIINEDLVEKFLRTTITISVVAFFIMSFLAILEIVNWLLLLPGLISCAGVVVSFGIYINILDKRGGGLKDYQTTPGITRPNKPMPHS